MMNRPRFAGSRLIRCSVFAAAMSASLAFAPSAFAEDQVDVKIDFAKIVKLERPASTIIIGNPGIADASVQDDKTLVLTGRSAGSTNMIIIDDLGEEIANVTVSVSSNTHKLTTVFYGIERQTLSCTPVCEQVISVGDSETAFSRANEQIQGRQAFSTPK